MLGRLRARPEMKFFGVLPRVSRGLAAAWWGLLLARGVLPAVLAVAIGSLVGAVRAGHALGGPLVFVGVVFVLTQVLAPLHAEIGSNLGERTSSWLNDQLLAATLGPPGIAHLERQDLVDDLVMARDFDLGISGPPISVSMGFIAGGLAEIVIGVASALVLFAYRWWVPLVLVPAWGATHWLLRESSVWKDRQTEQVLLAQRHADYAYRLAVDAPAAKEMRVFGLARWTVDRFASRRRQLVDLRWEATKLRQRPLQWALLLVLAANALVFWSLAVDADAGRVGLGSIVTFAQAALTVSALAFGGLNWSLSGCAQPVEAVLKLQAQMAPAGELDQRGDGGAAGLPARELRFRDVTFRYPGAARPVLDGFDLTIPAGSSLAIVGQNGAGKTTLAKLLCRLHDPEAGAVEADGIDVRTLDVASWRSRVTAVFQDFVRYELPLRDNVAPRGADDEAVLAALDAAGAGGLASLDTVLAKGYEDGTDLSGGQWQRIALARALCAVGGGAGVVILDEPTAQLDVGGEAEVFERILAATRACTTILVSHRFSTVRHADRICVLDAGKVVELGTHDELMALGGRYRTMFDLQASRFAEGADDEEGDVVSLDA